MTEMLSCFNMSIEGFTPFFFSFIILVEPRSTHGDHYIIGDVPETGIG